MDADLKRGWVKALRSGGYTQGRGRLKSGNTYCCLGVLACVMGREWRGDELRTGELLDLPKSVRSEIGALITMNDSKGYSFAQIADYIDANL
jgi:hypothetical protein